MAIDDVPPSRSGIDGLPLRMYASETIQVTWDQTRCLHFAECVRGLPRVFEPGRKPWIAPQDAHAIDVAEVIRRCPTGALQYESTLEPNEIGPSPTTVLPTVWGPILLHGESVLASGPEHNADNTAETRMALCACARSAHAPHCDGSCREVATNPELPSS